MSKAVIYAVAGDNLGGNERERLIKAAESYCQTAGHVVDDEFVDHDREVRWARRPQTQQLLRYVTDPRCEVDAVVVPDAFTAFSTEDLRTAAALLQHHGVDLHLTDHGPVPHRVMSANAATDALQSAQKTSSLTAFDQPNPET